MSRRDQDLAVVAWRLVGALGPEGGDLRGYFRGRAMRLGPMLVTSGLAATAAFHEAKAGPARAGALASAYGAVVDGLARHVLGDPHATGTLLVTETGGMDAVRYRAASADARVFALWVRRAAEALIPRSEQRDDG